jgi:hypothetical protein
MMKCIITSVTFLAVVSAAPVAARYNYKGIDESQEHAALVNQLRYAAAAPDCKDNAKCRQRTVEKLCGRDWKEHGKTEGMTRDEFMKQCRSKKMVICFPPKDAPPSIEPDSPSECG